MIRNSEKINHVDCHVFIPPSTYPSWVQGFDFLSQQTLIAFGQTSLEFLVSLDATTCPPLCQNKVLTMEPFVDKNPTNKISRQGFPLYLQPNHRDLLEHWPRQVIPCPATPVERMRSHPIRFREGWWNQVSAKWRRTMCGYFSLNAKLFNLSNHLTNVLT